jgi:hypothetical protein
VYLIKNFKDVFFYHVGRTFENLYMKANLYVINKCSQEHEELCLLRAVTELNIKEIDLNYS